jgi:hypothetical protein
MIDRNFKRLLATAVLLCTGLPVSAQTVEELRRTLTEKESEIELLRHRIEVLERELTPRRVMHGSQGFQPGDVSEESNRALERALVRQGGLLLSKGSFEIEPNFVYSHASQTAPYYSRDAFGPGLTLRAGLPWQSQLEITLPFVIERQRIEGRSFSSNGKGDISLGLSHQLMSEKKGWPSLIGTLQYQASTGRNTVLESDTPVARGSGFDSLQASVTALKRVDPLVFFGSYSFTRNFSETKGGDRANPGDIHGFRLGTGLAASPTTSLRTAFNLSFPEKFRLNGVALAETDSRLGTMEFGATVVLTETVALDVLVAAGITDASPDYRVGIALPIRY